MKQEIKTSYKVIQIMPVNDIWIRNKEDDGSYYFDKAVCMALIEYTDNTKYEFRFLHYFCRCDLDCIEEDQYQAVDDIFFTSELPHNWVEKYNSMRRDGMESEGKLTERLSRN